MKKELISVSRASNADRQVARDASEHIHLSLRAVSQNEARAITEFTTAVSTAVDVGAAPPELTAKLSEIQHSFSSRVGETSLIRVRNLERRLNVSQLYLKFEGGNPSGTQKDRAAFPQVLDAVRRGYDGVTAATCGNYGCALAAAAKLSGLRCVVYVPEAYHTARSHEMLEHGAVIVRVPVDYEIAVAMSRERARTEGLYDANPGGANTQLQMEGYAPIATEILSALGDVPTAVAVSVSNGTTLAGVFNGFLNLQRRGKAMRVPHMVAGSSFGKNPIIHAFIEQQSTCVDLPADVIRETKTNEPLVNWHAIDGQYALDAVRNSHGWAGYASDRAMQACARLIREEEGINVLPAATAGLLALVNARGRNPLLAGRYVAVITGRG